MDLLLLETAHVSLIKELDHVEEVWLCLFDLLYIDAKFTQPLFQARNRLVVLCRTLRALLPIQILQKDLLVALIC